MLARQASRTILDCTPPQSVHSNNGMELSTPLVKSVEGSHVKMPLALVQSNSSSSSSNVRERTAVDSATALTNDTSSARGLTEVVLGASKVPLKHHNASNGNLSNDPNAQHGPSSLQDTDSIDQAKLPGIFIGVGIVLVILLVLLCMWRRKKKRGPQLAFAPTPSLVLRLHTRLDSASDRPSCDEPSSSFPPTKRRRASTATTTMTVATTTRSSACSAATATNSIATGDKLLLSNACVDPVISALRIPLHEIQVGPVVGRGGFGEVHRGSFHDQRVAIKRLLPERRTDLVHIEALLMEAQFVSALHHAHIVRFVGVAWESMSELCFVTEFMDGGDLRSLLKMFDRVEHRPRGFDADKTKIAMDIADALAYLHAQSPAVVHRDLKSRNVLLDKNRNAKLADFGVARERIDSTMTAGVGSSMWMAPEVLNGERYDEKADIYSFGVVLSELDTHQSPYWRLRDPRDGGRKIPNVTLLQLVALGKLTVEFSTSSSLLTTQMIQLGQKCVARQPADRPTAVQLILQLARIQASGAPSTK